MREQGLFDPARLVFIDETSANTKMVRLYGRCARGERLVDLEPHGHWKTITFVATLRQNGMTAPCTIDGAMNGGRFLTYVERCLAPTLQRNDIVMLDNLPAHRVAGVRDAIEARGATLCYLPKYSPDLTLDEVVGAMRDNNIPGSRTAVWRFFHRHKITFKKNLAGGRAAARGRSAGTPTLDARTGPVRSGPAGVHR